MANRIFRLKYALLGLLLVMCTSISSAQQNLPQMGEPADAALSPLQEQQLGAQYMRQIRVSLPLVRDVQIEEYIQFLGERLAASAGKTDIPHFTFFVIDEATINAFAIPGGYIGINAGLIQVMAREDQLASVIAHEVAHVTQRHHARSFATGNRGSLSAAATIIAAILIGQASPEAGQATLAAGLAATQQFFINFTRSNEIEADRIGIDILSTAQFDTNAMGESFAILQRKNRLNTSVGQIEYLRTHPLDNNRIAEANDRAVGLPRRRAIDSVDFDLFKARLAVLTSSDDGNLMRTYQASFDTNPTVSSSYALALLHARANRHESTTIFLDELNKLAPAHPMAQLIKADILAAQDNTDAGISLLTSMSELYPDRYSIVEKLLDQLIASRKLSTATDIANRYIRGNSKPNPLAWRQLANIQQRLGDSAGSHESLAQYFTELNEIGSAAKQLELALRHVPTASQDELRIQANLKSLRGN